MSRPERGRGKEEERGNLWQIVQPLLHSIYGGRGAGRKNLSWKINFTTFRLIVKQLESSLHPLCFFLRCSCYLMYWSCFSFSLWAGRVVCRKRVDGIWSIKSMSIEAILYAKKISQTAIINLNLHISLVRPHRLIFVRSHILWDFTVKSTVRIDIWEYARGKRLLY